MPPGTRRLLHWLPPLGSVSLCSVAYATPQLHCPPGQAAQAPPSELVIGASTLFSSAPLLVCTGLAALSLVSRRKKGDPPTSFVAGLGSSGLAIALVAIGLFGSATAAILALMAMISGAWVRCV